MYDDIQPPKPERSESLALLERKLIAARGGFIGISLRWPSESTNRTSMTGHSGAGEPDIGVSAGIAGSLRAESLGMVAQATQLIKGLL
jgi:hypothetical protein